MSDDNSDSYFVPAPGEAGGSPKPPPGEEAPDAPSGPAAPPPRPGPGQGAGRTPVAPGPPAAPIPPAASSPPRQVYVPEQQAAAPSQAPPERPSAPAPPAASSSPRQVYVPEQQAAAPSQAPPERPASAGPPTTVAPIPAVAPKARRPRRPRRSRPRFRLPKKRWLIVAIPLLLIVGFVGYLYSLFAGIDRIDLTGTLTPQAGQGVNYLIAGSDKRADGSVSGERADTLIVMRVSDGVPKMMSVPRDLWVPIAGTDGSAKVNAAYNGGPQRLVATVQDALDIPIHHYVEVDFVTFGSLVDAVGGVEIDFPNPVFDPGSGLSVEQAGPTTLDGEQALAYVRSRQYTEVIDGQPQKDPTADIGRQLRQQNFMKAVMGKVGATRNPIGLTRVARALGKDLKIDDDLTAFGALGLARGLAGTSPESLVLPTEPGREGAQQVLYVKREAAVPILDQFR
jgi:LCP family protein required for cell wall assembly